MMDLLAMAKSRSATNVRKNALLPVMTVVRAVVPTEETAEMVGPMVVVALAAVLIVVEMVLALTPLNRILETDSGVG
jgi:hypothetical protein